MPRKSEYNSGSNRNRSRSRSTLTITSVEDDGGVVSGGEGDDDEEEEATDGDGQPPATHLRLVAAAGFHARAAGQCSHLASCLRKLSERKLV
jgi:hypothetical protein